MAVGLAATPLALLAQDDADEEEGVELDRVQVTGSRIKRADVEGALPVTVIDRDMIEMSGESNAADLLRNLTFNSQGSYRPQSGSDWGGSAFINLRGIGSSRTLVLVDGRRMPMAPLQGAAADLSTVPLGSIERIEILSDGASSVYGSDAIGGVVNIITRKDFQGAELMIGQASVDPEGGDREEGSIVFGASSSTSSLTAGLSWNDRDILFARDLPWYTPGHSTYGNDYTTVNADGSPNFDFGALNGGCEHGTPGAFHFYPSPNAADGSGQRCAYNFALVSADEASSANKALYMRATHEINNDWTVWSNANYAKTDTFGRYAPVPDSSYWYDAPIPVDSPNNPSNPASGMYDPVTLPVPTEIHWWHRFDALGNRDNYISSELLDMTVGMTGWVGNAELDFGVRRQSSKTYDIGYNYLVIQTAVAFITDGTYDLQFPHENDADTLNAMKATIARVAHFDQNETFASVAWDMFETDSGPIQWVVGAEYREEDYFDQYDSLSEAGAIGGSAGNSSGGPRDVTSAYFETLIPVTDNLEVGVAGRHDDYSDYGSDFSPKVSMRWRATDELVVRASVGEGFNAPSLPITTALDSFSADSVKDPQTCVATGNAPDCSIQISVTRTANPGLQSEQSTQLAFGLAWSPNDWFSGTFDYYDIEIDNRITFFSASTILAREQAGDPIPPGLSVTRGSTGFISNLTAGYGNEGDLETSGFDVNLRATFDLGDGRFTSNLQTSYVNSLSFDGGRDRVEDPGAPAYRAIWSNVYEIGDFGLAWNVNTIGSQCDDIVAGACVGHVPTWTTSDIQANYFTPWDSKLTLGARNVTNKQPPIGVGFFDSRDYDFNLYDGYGRTVYARLTQTF
jgi:iron complex outermembrane receptor protein